MRCDYKLRLVSELREKPRDSLPVPDIYGHHHIVEHSETQRCRVRALHKGKKETQPHRVLMTLAVESEWGRSRQPVEIDFKFDTSIGRSDVSGKSALVRSMDLLIEGDKAVSYGIIKIGQHAIASLNKGGSKCVCIFAQLLRSGLGGLTPLKSSPILFSPGQRIPSRLPWVALGSSQKIPVELTKGFTKRGQIESIT